ncbi:MAG: 4Fe-4S binding protein [candidate division Zixibacteria bacterium]|nr:4Fe-4S binding protein [candidate division Zixibacteria bacterium]
MGHLVGKDLYRALGRKIDNLTMRAPWNETLYAILKELYTEEEADVAVRMPYAMSTLDRIAEVTGYDRDRLQRILDGLAAKGLVVDVRVNGAGRYILSPLIIGIFEFTMMRTRGELNTKQWARLFHDYLNGDDSFYAANFRAGAMMSPLRVLPYGEAIEQSEHVEILDYEKAAAVVDEAKTYAVGICSCRHEKLHVGKKTCAVPLDLCTTMNRSCDYMVRHGFARAVPRSVIHDNLAQAREMGLVLCADNVRREVSFICFCCGCCCNVLLGISKFGYPHTVVTSSFIARANEEACAACGTCVEACPIKAISRDADGPTVVDEAVCIGCGVCGVKCPHGALTLVKRKQRVLHPDVTFERIILQCLERGTLQNFMFSDPGRLTHKFLRAVVGGFLRLPPVKKALMTDTLRSSFLERMHKQGG